MDDLFLTNILAWDENCKVRAHDVESGVDQTYNKVLVPYVLNMLKRHSTSTDTVLDVGCGCGFLTSKISDGWSVEGLDISSAAIKYSKAKYPHISFIQGDACTVNLQRKYNVVVANMVVHNLYDLPGFYRNIRSLLKKDGTFLMVLLHPFYWAREKLSDCDFVYEKQHAYSHKLKNCPRPIKYYHRPICDYISLLEKNGLLLWSVEPIFEEYDVLHRHEHPHILGIIAKYADC
jgi:SAM-dependent methyltransferase